VDKLLFFAIYRLFHCCSLWWPPV